jgi:hypothetical protein
MIRKTAAIIVFSWVMWSGDRGHASPLFELVGGDGFNSRTIDGGSAATYFNPALLPRSATGLTLGIMVLSDQIGITLDSRDDADACQVNSCDVPVVFGTGPESFRHSDGSTISSPAVPTEWLENGNEGLPARPRQAAGTGQNARAYQSIGLVTPVFGKRAILGFHALIPLSEFTTAHAFYNDEREQYFSNSLHPELYADRMTATSLAFGVGSQLTDKFSAGLTFTLSLKNTASAPVYVSDLADLDTVLLDSDIGVQASVSPHFGVAYAPRDDLLLTGTVHTKQAFEIETSFDYFLSTGTEQGSSIEFTHAYMPLTLGGGAAYEVSRDEQSALTLAATMLYARWSTYKDRHSETPHPDYVWRDTVSGSVGARYTRKNTTGRLDLTYQPSPVPPQTGRSNYVDNDRAGINGGVDLSFRLWGSTFRAGIALQAHRLFYQHVTKFTPPANPQPNPNADGFGDNYYPQLVVDEVADDTVDGILGDPIPGRDGLQTNNPGFPGFASDGWILGAGVNISVVY